MIGVVRVDTGLVQYYLAAQGAQSDGALAILAARAALLARARWADRPDFRHWRAIRMTKVVLEAPPGELARVRAATEALALARAGGEAPAGEDAALLVLPPQTKARAAPLLGHLHLARKRRGPAPEPPAGPALVLVAATDLGMHGGKLAAQAAHGAMLAADAHGGAADWAAWAGGSAGIALRGMPSDSLAALAARFPASAVRDAGFTQVAAGSLTVVAIPPGDPLGAHLLAEGQPW